MRSEPALALFTTAITEAELLYGIALLLDGRRRRSLPEVVDRIFAEDLVDRVLPFDRWQHTSSPTSPRADVAPGGRLPKQTPASPPSPGRVAPLWPPEMSGISRVAGWS